MLLLRGGGGGGKILIASQLSLKTTFSVHWSAFRVYNLHKQPWLIVNMVRKLRGIREYILKLRRFLKQSSKKQNSFCKN